MGFYTGSENFDYNLATEFTEDNRYKLTLEILANNEYSMRMVHLVAIRFKQLLDGRTNPLHDPLQEMAFLLRNPSMGVYFSKN